MLTKADTAIRLKKMTACNPMRCSASVCHNTQCCYVPNTSVSSPAASITLQPARSDGPLFGGFRNITHALLGSVGARRMPLGLNAAPEQIQSTNTALAIGSVQELQHLWTLTLLLNWALTKGVWTLFEGNSEGQAPWPPPFLSASNSPPFLQSAHAPRQLGCFYPLFFFLFSVEAPTPPADWGHQGNHL